MRISDTICAVVPVYNAERTLRELIKALAEVLTCFSAYRIVLVDDASTDQSFRIIRELCAIDEHITGIRLKENYGQQSAVFCGLHYSEHDYTVIIDDDLEQDPADILALYDEIKKGYDAVYGIDGTNNKGMFRGIGSKLRDRLFDCITDKPKDKKVGSFRIMNWETVRKILRAETQFVYVSLEMLKYTNRIGNITIQRRSVQPSTYRPAGLIKLLMKMFLYYAPGAFWEKRRVKGRSYDIREIV